MIKQIMTIYRVAAKVTEYQNAWRKGNACKKRMYICKKLTSLN